MQQKQVETPETSQGDDHDAGRERVGRRRHPRRKVFT
jgi:hypothetical protein